MGGKTMPQRHTLEKLQFNWFYVHTSVISIMCALPWGADLAQERSEMNSIKVLGSV